MLLWEKNKINRFIEFTPSFNAGRNRAQTAWYISPILLVVMTYVTKYTTLLFVYAANQLGDKCYKIAKVKQKPPDRYLMCIKLFILFHFINTPKQQNRRQQPKKTWLTHSLQTMLIWSAKHMLTFMFFVENSSADVWPKIPSQPGVYYYTWVSSS